MKFSYQVKSWLTYFSQLTFITNQREIGPFGGIYGTAFTTISTETKKLSYISGSRGSMVDRIVFHMEYCKCGVYILHLVIIPFYTKSSFISILNHLIGFTLECFMNCFDYVLCVRV